MYRRRTVLAFGSSLLAGCTGISSEDESTETPPSRTTERRPRGRFPEVSVAADAVAHEREVAVEAEAERSFTEARPARLVVRFTNTADRTRRFFLGSSPPFSSYTGSHTDEDAKLVLVPDTREDTFVADPPEQTADEDTETASRHRLVPVEPIGGCWYAGKVVGSVDVRRPTELRPGETIRERYTLLGHPLNEQCLPTGEYRFEDERYFGTDEPWGFSVLLGDAGR